MINNETFSILIWNIGNPSVERAQKQEEWLLSRPEDIIILTETKRSEGCLAIERFFKFFNGYNVIFPKPEGNEYGVMVLSKKPLKTTLLPERLGTLRSRIVSVLLEISGENVEIIGTYVPSRDQSIEKIEKKRTFLEELAKALEAPSSTSARIFCGDLNILEPNHIPHYHVYQTWEYDFYSGLKDLGFTDVFRKLNPTALEYSWVGRMGDGYRYDHCFASPQLAMNVNKCLYVHEPRLDRLSDHSALSTEFMLKR